MRVNRIKFEQLFPFSIDLIPDFYSDPIFLDQASIPGCRIAGRILNASIGDDVEISLAIWGGVGEVRDATHRQNLVIIIIIFIIFIWILISNYIRYMRF